MRVLPLFVLFVLTACSGNTFQPIAQPAKITQTLKPGEIIVCVSTIVRIGLPSTDVDIIAFVKRTWTCELIGPDPHAPAEPLRSQRPPAGAFR